MTAVDFRRLLSCKTAKSVGLYGEQIAVDLLEKSGYSVTVNREGTQCGDLEVVTPDGEVLAVEVKTSRRGNFGYQFTLWKKNRTDHRHSDIVLLLAALKTGRVVPFVIPTDDVSHLRAIRFRTHPEDYDGKYAVYRQPAHDLSLEAANG